MKTFESFCEVISTNVESRILSWHGRNNISWTKKFEYDVYYVDHIGAVMDIKVFFTTIKKVLGRADINQEGGTAATMEAFNGKN